MYHTTEKDVKPFAFLHSLQNVKNGELSGILLATSNPTFRL